MKKITLLHLYADIMSLYGSYANIVVLRRHLEDAGLEAEIVCRTFGDKERLPQADFVYMGAGTERSRTAVLGDFAPYAAEIKERACAGVPMLFAGTAMELLGSSIEDKNGDSFMALGVMSFEAREVKKRIVGDVYAKSELCTDPVVGFINKSTVITGVEQPLVTSCPLGFGNECEHGSEGAVFNNLVASELTGPLLVKNPQLLELFVRRVAQHAGAELPEKLPEYKTEAAAYATTEAELKKRI